MFPFLRRLSAASAFPHCHFGDFARRQDSKIYNLISSSARIPFFAYFLLVTIVHVCEHAHTHTHKQMTKTYSII